MPASSAARTHWVAMSFSTWEPCVSQLPNVISEILKPLFPRYLNSMGFTLAEMVARGKGRALPIWGAARLAPPAGGRVRSGAGADVRVLGERRHGAGVQDCHMPGDCRLPGRPRRL